MATLPAAYRGDEYEFRMIFPDAAMLAGAPENVLAQVRRSASSQTIAATWAVTVENPTTLKFRMEAVLLAPGSYVTDVQVGAVTYLKQTPFTVNPDVSRAVS